MSDYSMNAYELAVAMYEKSDLVGVALHNRPAIIREAWLAAARLKIASGAVTMDDIATGTAH
jgi:hypothetical protein